MKKVVCISSMLVLIQLCVGMQDNLRERYSNIAKLDAKYSETFLKYCMLHINYKIAKDDFYGIARGADLVFCDVNNALKIGTEEDQAGTEEDNAFIKTYFESAYKEYIELLSKYNPCDNVGNHPHRSYRPEEDLLFRFIFRILFKK